MPSELHTRNIFPTESG